MTELLTVVVVGLAVIAGATLVGDRLGVAAPLVLVVVGVAASFLPVLDSIRIDPEWILAGLLPPLLYSAAVSMPAMNFRREFGAISGLSVVLVIASSLVLGLFFMLAIPGLGFAWGVALGAIISPTDAVATSIIKKTQASRRVVAILDGESLLNDATALVLLRTAIIATAASFSFWGAVGTFAYAVVVAVGVGLLVGWLNLVVRRSVTDPTVNTVISFTVPFIAFLPAELLEASGLVAAVVAGLVTGIRAPRHLSPQHRLSDSQNWRTVELVLEGIVFLTLGLQIQSVVTLVERDHQGAEVALLISAAALLLVLVVRAAYVAPLIWVLSVRARRGVQMQDRLQGLHEQLTTPEGREEATRRTRAGPDALPSDRVDRQVERFAFRLRRMLADIDYFARAPLGWREGTVVVWAGMRGAVTVAAVQTLPSDTPDRSVLVFIAFAVALMSLIVQGATTGFLVRGVTPPIDQQATAARLQAERDQIDALLLATAQAIPAPESGADDTVESQRQKRRDHRLVVIDEQRSALLDARDHGTFDADVLASELANLDAAQIALEMRAG